MDNGAVLMSWGDAAMGRHCCINGVLKGVIMCWGCAGTVVLMAY